MKVIKDFRDKEQGGKLYQIGDTYEGSRGEYLAKMGYVDLAEGPAPKDHESMTKADLQEVLEDKGIDFKKSETKAELLEKLEE